jgi:hypothetical protein
MKTAEKNPKLTKLTCKHKYTEIKMETGYWKNYLQTEKESEKTANTYGKDDSVSQSRNDTHSSTFRKGHGGAGDAWCKLV